MQSKYTSNKTKDQEKLKSINSNSKFKNLKVIILYKNFLVFFIKENH